ncbi:sugar-phosphatase [Frigoribacterium sp. PhB116]|nr:sugar-phosphatase [Frigoribacterium sp. PhB116]
MPATTLPSTAVLPTVVRQTGAMSSEQPRTTLTARAVVFDMDGTLVDSTALVERIWTEWCGPLGLHPGEVLAFAHGRQTADTVRRFLPELDEEAVLRHVDALLSVEGEAPDGVVEIPGAAAFVAALPGQLVALVTSAPGNIARTRTAVAGVGLPAVVLASEDVPVGKPAPDGYLRAAELLGVDPGDVVVFEDAEAGLQAARASGAQVVVVGDHDGPAAEGLTRITDYRGAVVELGDDGLLTITL